MKYRIALAVSLFALSAGSYATTLCQEKEQNILKEISYAEKHQNQNRIDGLNKALSEVRANCSLFSLTNRRSSRCAGSNPRISGCQVRMVRHLLYTFARGQ